MKRSPKHRNCSASKKQTLNVIKANFMIFKTRRKKINTPVTVTINNKEILSRLNFLKLELMNK